MQFIAHRINTLSELTSLPETLGVELDVRDHQSRLIIQHDPFVDGEDFEAYLQHVGERLIILNIKSERIEHKILDLLNAHKKTNFFFLDSSFPMMMTLSSTSENRLAIRFSEFESIDTVIAMQHRVKWVWIDCFSHCPLTPENYSILKKLNLKLCLVSPDLLGRPEDIETLATLLRTHALSVDAICTKTHNISRWTHALHVA